MAVLGGETVWRRCPEAPVNPHSEAKEEVYATSAHSCQRNTTPAPRVRANVVALASVVHFDRKNQY